MGNWDALTVQMVWFAADARRSSAATLYSALLGQEPDSFQSNKVPTAPIPTLSAASGVLDDVAFSLSVQTSRVDLVVQAKVEDTDERPPLLGHVKELISEKLVPQANLIGSHLNSVNRLAIVTTVCKPTDSHVEANKVLAGLVGVKLQRDDVTDLAFQVNARMPLGDSSGIQINRFLKFSVMAFHSLTLDLSTQVFSQQDAQAYSASLAIDVNIVPHFQPLSVDLQEAIWNKLGEETIRLREIGNLEGLW